MSEGVLDRQWADVQSVLLTEGDMLDTAYLRQWATHLIIADLLDAALRGTPPPRLSSSGDDSQQLHLDI